MSNKRFAVFYKRVSTTKDEQKDSLVNQTKLKDSYLQKHPEIICVAEFAESESGKSDIRPEYSRMLKYIEEHQEVELLMVKDTKRLFRSTGVADRFKSFAKKNGIKLLLLGTGEILDVNAEERRLLYSIDAVINEEYVLRQSEYARIAHRQKMQEKRLNKNNVTFGYSWDEEKKDIVINGMEAEIVRKIFELYVYRQYGNKEIRKYLADTGYPRSPQTVNKYLVDSTYVGDFTMNKKGTDLEIGIGAKSKRFDKPKEQWVHVERPDLAIVSNELFELAQKIRESRRSIFNKQDENEIQGRFRGTHIFSSKIFCGVCGCSYVHGYSDRAKKIAIYRDSFNLKTKDPNGKCANPTYKVYEQDMIDMTREVINGVIGQSEQCFDNVLPVIQSVLADNSSTDNEIKRMRAEIIKMEKRKMKLRETILSLDGVLKEDFIKDYENCDALIKGLEEQLQQLVEQDSQKKCLPQRIEEIVKVLQQMKQIKVDEVNREVVELFVKKIVVRGDGSFDLILNSTDVFSRVDKIKKQGSGCPASFNVKKKISTLDMDTLLLKSMEIIQGDKRSLVNVEIEI